MTIRKITLDILSVILILPISVLGKPECRTRFRTEVMCTRGKDDYILHRGLVSDNNNTEAITLKDCRISDVELDAFKNILNLKEIDLSRNKISDLKLGVFDGIPTLLSLRLSNNLLTSLPLGLFDNVPNLQRLVLSDNAINTFELGIFHRLSKLIRLELSGNAFFGKDLHADLLIRNTDMKHLHLSRNYMSETPEQLLNSVQGLIILGLNNCSLTEIPKFATRSNLKTMKHLRLQTNKIDRLDDPDTFTNLDNLETLNLLENLIEKLNENVFKPLSNLKAIFLPFNKIEYIPETLFKNMSKLETIDLSYNRLKFVPVNAFRGTRLEKLDLTGNKISFFEKNFCSRLSPCIKRLTTFYFSDNPLQCACLSELLDEVKKYGIEYEPDTKQELACAAIDDVTCIRHKVGDNNIENDEDISATSDPSKIYGRGCGV